MKRLLPLSTQTHTASIEQVGGKGIELFIDNDHITAFRERANLLGRTDQLRALDGGKRGAAKTAFQLHQERTRK